MLRELQLRSSDFKQVMKYKKQHPSTHPTCGPREKIWTAKVTVSPEEFRMPRRERLTVGQHVERMQFARAPRNHQLLPRERFRDPRGSSGRGLGPAAGGRGEDRGDYGDATREETEGRGTKRQEIKMNVTFKSKEPRKRLTNQPNDLKPPFPAKKAERSIAGLTNRSLFHLAEFPGDLMLMNQDLISRGVCPRDVTEAGRLGEGGIWKEHSGKPASHHY